MAYIDDDQIYIPDNIKEDETFKIPNRNLGEAVVVDLILYKGIQLTPFITEIKITATIISIGCFSILFLVGIKGESVTEFLITLSKYMKKQKKMRYRKCNEKGAEVETDEEIEPSKAEKFVRRIGEKLFGRDSGEEQESQEDREENREENEREEE